MKKSKKKVVGFVSLKLPQFYPMFVFSSTNKCLLSFTVLFRGVCRSSMVKCGRADVVTGVVKYIGNGHQVL